MKVWIKGVGMALLSVMVLTTITGTIYETHSRTNAATEFPAPGKRVDIGNGRHIQLDCRGQGLPVVVFESGLDSLGSLSWAAVQDAIAQITRACAYSRAGMMWSDANDRPFSSAHVAEDLHHALSAAAESGPFVMVGHSLGGPYLLTYTGLYREEVAGMVLVDASHPDQVTRMRAAIGKDIEQPTGLLNFAASIAWTGLVRAVRRNEPAAPLSAPPSIQAPSAAWFPTSLRSLAQEMTGIEATMAIPEETRKLGDRPLVVLTRSEKTSTNDLQQMQLTPEQGDRMDSVWRALHDEEATWSTRSRHEVVPRSTHYIQFDQPQAVITAVREVVEQVRLDTALRPTSGD
jgi:pimeloyl-ACP methyl ester carboxylesterase